MPGLHTESPSPATSSSATSPPGTSSPAGLTTQSGGDGTVLAFSGQLDAAGAAQLWRPTLRAAHAAASGPLGFDLQAVSGIDMLGATLLAAAEAAHGSPATVTGADPKTTTLLARARAAGTEAKPAPRPPRITARQMLAAGFGAVSGGVAFVGEAVIAVIHLPSRWRMFRLGDVLREADQAGFRALPLVLLLGYLIGLILAFQSSIPMRQFGADLFVANLVSISLLRELGPLLAAVVLAGRTGSAFAAEIGTMKVNQEIDALVVMGIDPMTLLVLPRMLAALLVMPVLTLLLDFAGLLGMTTVMTGFGYSLPAIQAQVQSAATVGDLTGGLLKAAVFGAAVAAIGCRSGLGTGIGPRAVGFSATAAVVGGIVATILIDGLFAILFYRLGL
ncbi:MAG: ABC transporter permease [Proteobacteria bacterium]|nr:ABC transporter permease [Pseudomonadota bacterium]